MNLEPLKVPHLTEKTYRQKQQANQVTFLVEKAANKIQIKQAVETRFKVTVEAVNTVRVRGKIKRMGRFAGKRPDWKKAIVTLKAGDRIEYFEGA